MKICNDYEVCTVCALPWQFDGWVIKMLIVQKQEFHGRLRPNSRISFAQKSYHNVAQENKV